MMNTEAYKKIVSSERYLNRPVVRAAGPIAKDSSTEIVDVKKLSQNIASGVQYVCIKNTVCDIEIGSRNRKANSCKLFQLYRWIAG